MTGRAIAETLTALVLAIVLGILIAAVFGMMSGESFVVAFTDYGPRIALGLLLPVYLLWALFLLISNLRNRTRSTRRKFVTGLIGAIAVAVLYIIMWQVLSMMVGDDWGWVLLTVVLFSTPIFLLAAAISLAITHLVAFRPNPVTV